MQYVEAEKAYLKALELNPELHGATYNIGILYIDNEMPDHGVIQRFEKAIKNLNDYKPKLRLPKKRMKPLPAIWRLLKKKLLKSKNVKNVVANVRSDVARKLKKHA